MAVDVGWLIDAPHAQFVYDAPRPIGRPAPASSSPKAAARCPAIIDLERRLFEVRCPFDLHLRVRNLATARPVIVNAAGRRSTIAKSALARVVHLTDRDRWRHPERPILQVSAPWRFVADEPVWMSELPPYFHHRTDPWPGVVMGGRFPIDVWPRSLMWSFEWHDPARDLVVKRGDPWFYVRFETADPARPVRLVEAEMTDALRAYCDGLDGVTSYVSRTYRLFETARARRPARLLQRRRTS